MSTLERVLAELATGATATVAAARLGVAPDLVDVMVAELERCGAVSAAPRSCGACPPEPARSPGCAGCPLAGRRPAPARAIGRQTI
ncbi:hypothetical protein [Cellulomonas sp. KRMCY2]|uniref:hypothetical protein n=1 Tax=Cellulomonas sp. KRMCY2 TaxID=1304865 RepID=UPI00045EB43D|nr:hypothetical protein [Cellulomonas sp. KRMCY2]